jgi:hypothetical protein
MRAMLIIALSVWMLGEGAAQASSARESNGHRLPVAKVKPNSVTPQITDETRPSSQQ